MQNRHLSASMKYIAFMLAMLMSGQSHAHQPALSTMILSKTVDGKYVLQINSSLTAFEGEIDYLYSKNSYKTPEAFNKLVINHFEKNVSFSINGDNTVKFVDPIVILGHETKLVVEVVGIPNDIKTIYLKNEMFKDIPRNQSILIMLDKGFPNQQYVLNNENNQEVQLELVNGEWKNNKPYTFIFKRIQSMYVLMVFLCIIAVVLLAVKRGKLTRFSRRNSLQKASNPA